MSQKKGNKKRPLIYYWILAIVLFAVLRFVANPISSEQEPEEVSYSEFIDMLENNEIKAITEDQYQYTFTIDDKDGNEKVYKTGLWKDDDLTERLLEKNQEEGNIEFGKEIETKMNP